MSDGTALLPVFTCSTTMIEHCDVPPQPGILCLQPLGEAGARQVALDVARERLSLDNLGPPRVAKMMKATFDAKNINNTWTAEVENYAVEFQQMLEGLPIEGDEATLLVSTNGSCVCRVRWTREIRHKGIVQCMSAGEAVAAAKNRGLLPVPASLHSSTEVVGLKYRKVTAPNGQTEIRPHWVLKIQGRTNMDVDATQQ